LGTSQGLGLTSWASGGMQIGGLSSNLGLPLGVSVERDPVSARWHQAALLKLKLTTRRYQTVILRLFSLAERSLLRMLFQLWDAVMVQRQLHLWLIDFILVSLEYGSMYAFVIGTD